MIVTIDCRSSYFGSAEFQEGNVYEDQHLKICLEGSVFNFRELNMLLHSDKTEVCCPASVFAKLYLQIGFEHAVRCMEGEYCVCLVDSRMESVFIANDPLGIQMVQYQINNVHGRRGTIYTNHQPMGVLSRMPPGSFWQVTASDKVGPIPYFTLPAPNTWCLTEPWISSDNIFHQLRFLLYNAVIKRCRFEQDTICLLSGGLASSVLAALLQEALSHRKQTLRTIAVGFVDSPHLQRARNVANLLRCKHTEVIVDRMEWKDCNEVKRDMAKIHYFAGKHITNHYPHVSHVFTGLGSDIMFGNGDEWFSSPLLFFQELRRLIQSFHEDSVIRQRTAYSVTFQSPYWDRNVLQYLHSLPPNVLHHEDKHLLRSIFVNVYNSDKTLLVPHSVLWASKQQDVYVV